MKKQLILGLIEKLDGRKSINNKGWNKVFNRASIILIIEKRLKISLKTIKL